MSDITENPNTEETAVLIIRHANGEISRAEILPQDGPSMFLDLDEHAAELLGRVLLATRHKEATQ